jgi:hypothetical protein
MRGYSLHLVHELRNQVRMSPLYVAHVISLICNVGVGAFDSVKFWP